MIIEKIELLQSDWKKPWFTEGMMAWPRNLSGREYNGQNDIPEWALVYMEYGDPSGLTEEEPEIRHGRSR
jgi:antirestriction protein ArdC